MANATIPAEAVGSPSLVSAFYSWEVPDKPVAVHLSLEVVDRLERDVLESFKAVTKRGSEVGGLLLGRTLDGGKRIAVIEEYELVECEYSRGPLYLLAEADKRRLEDGLKRWKSAGSRLSVVGYFRSNTRRDLVLDDDDLALAEEYFAAPDNVILLVKPFAMKPSVAGFFIRENDRLQGESTYLQFPFKRSELLKAYAHLIIPAGTQAAVREERPAGPVMVPKREDRAPAAAPVERESRPTVVPVTIKREEEKPAPRAAPKREEPAPVAAAAPVPPKREERPVAPVTAKREEPPAPPVPAPAALKREERPPAAAEPAKTEPPAPLKREERPAAALNFKREERPAVTPPPISKREERPGPVLVSKREEPAPKREERPPVSLRREERPPAPPATVRREERPAPAAAPKPEGAPQAPAARPAAAVTPKPEPAAPPPKQQAAVAAPAMLKAEAVAVPAFTATAAEAVAIPETAAPGLFRRIIRSRLIWIAVILVLVLAGAFIQYRGYWRSPKEVKPDDSSLALKVERNAGQLLLSWNRNASLIATAQRAMLSITDGDHKEDVDLDLGQLRSGSIVYSPLTTDVSFRLEVTDLKRGKSLSESVRVLAGRPSPSVPLIATPPKQTMQATDRPAPPQALTPPPPASVRAAEQQQQTTSAPPAATPAAEPVKTSAAAPVTAAPPKPESLAARLSAAQLPEPPSLETQASPLAGRPGIATPTPAAPPPPVKETAKPPASQPAAEQPKPQPPALAKVGGNVQEAKVLRRVTPAYPPLARQARVSGVVRVEATIGRDGKVKRAAAVSGPPLLRQSAVDAVMRWLYQPSLLNGEPVEVTTQVDVTFSLNR